MDLRKTCKLLKQFLPTDIQSQFQESYEIMIDAVNDMDVVSVSFISWNLILLISVLFSLQSFSRSYIRAEQTMNICHIFVFLLFSVFSSCRPFEFTVLNSWKLKIILHFKHEIHARNNCLKHYFEFLNTSCITVLVLFYLLFFIVFFSFIQSHFLVGFEESSRYRFAWKRNKWWSYE